MITKAVTQDVHGNTHIYRWKIYTYSEKISTKCSKCGKRISHSVSFQYQGIPDQEDWNKLEQRKQEWLAEEHICSKCLKEACKGEQDILDTSEIEATFKVIEDRKQQITALREDIELHLSLIREKIKDRVCLYMDNEYVIEYIGYESGYYFYGHKIDTRMPWLTTDTEIYVSEKGGGWGRSKTVNTKFTDMVFTEEIFSKRKERIQSIK